MKFSKIMHTTLFLTAMMLVAGCETSQNILDKIFRPKTDKVQHESVLPTDRESIATENSLKTYNPEDLKRGIIKGDWAIEQVYEHDAVWETAPYLRFEPNEKKVYGNNGCNTINAKYSYNPQVGTMVFSDIAQTMRLCNVEGITDTEISIALDATRYYTWEIIDTQYYLYFYNDNHVRVMTLMHQNFQFLNGTWKVTAINEEPVTDDSIKLVIDVDEGKIHGYTGCNTLNGTMEIDMNSANSISFQAIGITQRLCPPDNLETPLLVALEEADHAKPLSKDKAALIDTQGDVVIMLQRTSDK